MGCSPPASRRTGITNRTADAGINAAQGSRSVWESGRAFANRDYLGGTLNALGAGLSFAGAFGSSAKLWNATNVYAGSWDRAGFGDKRVSSLGRWLGSKRLTQTELLAYEKELARFGVSLKRGNAATELMDRREARAAFSSSENVVYLRKNATRFDAFHELQHVKHRALLGQEQYTKIGELARETYVFQQIWKNRRQFNYQEVKHSIDIYRRTRYEHRIGEID